eukprot:CCRYP_006829-RA/>CCRYP_006829-RA protein AED:0.49 eAED:0.43 QI:0/0/0/1/0/0/3/0/153
MILNVHSEGSYLSVTEAKSGAAGIFFLGSIPKINQPIKLNSAIAVLCTILKFKPNSALSSLMRRKPKSCDSPDKRLENLADYPSNAHPGGHHLTLCPLYVNMPTSPRFLARASTTSVQRGCADKVGCARIHKYPLPTLARVPRGTGHMSATAA